MLTALLICMENTFWNVSKAGNFVELFKKSFALFVKSGMKKKMEADIEILRSELVVEGGYPVVTEDFKAKFHRIVTAQYLRKFHRDCFYLHIDTSNHHFISPPWAWIGTKEWKAYLVEKHCATIAKNPLGIGTKGVMAPKFCWELNGQLNGFYNNEFEFWSFEVSWWDHPTWTCFKLRVRVRQSHFHVGSPTYLH